jgi:hypothetical protein
MDRFGLHEKELGELNDLRDSLTEKIGIVINGSTLIWALDRDNNFRAPFFKLGFISDS